MVLILGLLIGAVVAVAAFPRTVVTTTTETTTILSSTVEQIAKGETGYTLSGLSFPNYGEILVTYTATNKVSISLSVDSVNVTSPNSASAGNYSMPVGPGTTAIEINNGSCSVLGGCPGISVTISIVYEYEY